MAIITGVIADDFTGATDIAGFMAEQSWSVVLLPACPMNLNAGLRTAQSAAVMTSPESGIRWLKALASS